MRLCGHAYRTYPGHITVKNDRPIVDRVRQTGLFAVQYPVAIFWPTRCPRHRKGVPVLKLVGLRLKQKGPVSHASTGTPASIICVA
jgi:hypothetical protein